MFYYNRAETWTIKSANEKKLSSTEMDFWRRSARTTRMEKKELTLKFEQGWALKQVSPEKLTRREYSDMVMPNRWMWTEYHGLS